MLLAQTPEPAVLVDRILAVVEGRPVLLSEVRVMEQVSGRAPADALEALIDERLMLREAARLPQAALTAEEEERALESLRARVLAGTGSVSDDDLRPVARRQATIVKYVEFRFRPQVRVDEDAVRRAYDDASSGRPDAPDFEAAAPALRRRIEEDDLRQRMEAWVKDLRAGADVRYNAEPPLPAADGR